MNIFWERRNDWPSRNVLQLSFVNDQAADLVARDNNGSAVR